MKKRKRVQELEDTESFLFIRESLVEQLENNKLNTEYNRDLVNDYMALWIAKELLIEDINHRGVTVTYNNGGGQKGKKKNDSLSELNKTNTQMLKILDSLGLRPINAKVETEEDNDPL